MGAATPPLLLLLISILQYIQSPAAYFLASQSNKHNQYQVWIMLGLYCSYKPRVMHKGPVHARLYYFSTGICATPHSEPRLAGIDKHCYTTDINGIGRWWRLTASRHWHWETLKYLELPKYSIGYQTPVTNASVKAKRCNPAIRIHCWVGKWTRHNSQTSWHMRQSVRASERRWGNKRKE